MISLVFSLLVFPGLLFLTALAFFTSYLVRKLSARMQRRMGPSYVGPAGLLQPVYDFFKLLRYKEIVKTRYSMVLAAEVSLLIGMAFLVSSVILLPLSPYNARGIYDFLVFFYMVSVMPVFMLIIASLSMPGPYTSTGVSRMLTILTISEPAFFASLLTPLYLATSNSTVFMSIGEASSRVATLWTNPLTAFIIALDLIASIVSVQAKAMLAPFNIPEAEQELIAGFETEFSGPLLALASLLHEVELAVSGLAIVYIFLGGPAPFPHLSIQGILVLILKYVAVVLIATFIRNIFGRFRIEQALISLLKYGLAPALISVILASIYLAT